MLVAAYVITAAAEGVDPITAILTRDWVNIGAWSLLIGTWVTILVGALREWWVPGARYRRLETSSEEQSKTLATTASTLADQVKANEISSYFFKETVPKRGEPAND